MKIKISEVRILRITDVKNLDPIEVIFQDHEPKRGEFTIKCYGESWTHYWGGIWDGHTVASFILECNNQYIIGKLAPGMNSTINSCDREDVEKHLKIEIIKQRKGDDISEFEARQLYDDVDDLRGESSDVIMELNHELFQGIFGDEWWDGNVCLPQIPNDKYEYLERILNAVKDGITMMIKQESMLVSK